MADENLQNPDEAPDAEVPYISSDAAAGLPERAEPNADENAGSDGDPVSESWNFEPPPVSEPEFLPDSEPDPVVDEIIYPIADSPESPEEQAEPLEPAAEPQVSFQKEPDPESFQEEGDPLLAEEPDDIEPSQPEFDPVAAFLSTQSASGSPRLERPEDDQAAQAPVFHEEIAQDDPVHHEPLDEHAPPVDHEVPDEEYAEEEEFVYEAPPPPDHRRHPLMRVFNLFCWGLLLCFVGVLAGGFVYFRYAQERLSGLKNAAPPRPIDVVIHPGDSYRKVVTRLSDAGLLGSYMGIPDKYLMRGMGMYHGDTAKIRHGAYRFQSTMGLSEVYARLLKGSLDHKLTIPEGLTVRQVAERVAGQYDSFDPKRFYELTQDQGFITSLGMYVQTLEGYLLPGTYYFGPGMKEEDLVRLMVNEFRKAAETKLAGIEKKDDLSFHEHVILASLIEREARVDADRPLIASVILNRLQQKMRLQIDATVNFALNDWRRLNHQDLKIDSPFNTYKVDGLPPAPICNPRIESLMATYTAPETDFLFYVHRGDGHHEFARSYEEHQKNVREYITNRPKTAAK